MQRAQLMFAFCAIMFAQSGQVQAGIITTLPSWDGVTNVSPFGYPETPTFGQTVTASSENHVLNSFSFEMSVSKSMQFRGEVYAWDGTKATGSALFESAVTSTTSSAFQLVTFDTGGITLQNGQQYVLFASISKDYGTYKDSGSMGTKFTNTYGEGQFVFINDGGNASTWTTDPWTTVPIDLAFQAEFTAASAPEPTSIALLGSGAIALTCGALRRRKQPGLPN